MIKALGRRGMRMLLTATALLAGAAGVALATILNWSFPGVRRCGWGSRLRDLLFVVHARAII
jgi:hypothetical protein